MRYIFLFSLIAISSCGSKPFEENPVGNVFPTIDLHRLDDKAITLPIDLRGKAAVLVVACKQDVQAEVNPYTDYILFQKEYYPKIHYLELPVVDFWWKPMGGMIDGFMTNGIAPSLHKHVATFYGYRKPYLNQLGIKDKNRAHVYIIDPAGVIQYFHVGALNEEVKNEIDNVLEEYI